MPECMEPMHIAVLGKEYIALCVFRSDNHRSLYLRISEHVQVNGGCFLEGIPVLGDPATGAYQDILTGTPIQITRAANVTPA